MRTASDAGVSISLRVPLLIGEREQAGRLRATIDLRERTGLLYMPPMPTLTKPHITVSLRYRCRASAGPCRVRNAEGLERGRVKHKDFKPCHLCGKGMMHSGNPIFLRISVDRLEIDANAVRRAHGLELLLGGNTLLANVLGPDEDLARVIDGSHDLLMCGDRGSKPLPPYLWLVESEAA